MSFKRWNYFTNMNKQKRKRKTVSEFQPPKPRFIESARSTISQTYIESIKFNNNISSSLLKKIRKCYIYEINFPINSQLQKIHYGSFRFLNLYSITLPPSLSFIFPEAFKNCFNLKQVNFSKDQFYYYTRNCQRNRLFMFSKMLIKNRF